ncbi:MAG TPA: SDR family oxidoreductase [Vicinamibacteria bacterium]|nr:SDR family oxidoreductase [Vicinamibacteria bacterium]
MDLGLTGKVALIAGASRGLGKAVAETLAAEGARIAIASRNADALESAAKEIETRHRAEVLFRPTDVTIEREVNAWVAAAKKRFGRIDVLVANAGGPPASRFESTDVEAWKRGIELNLLSTIYLCRAVVPAMREQGSGRIVAITSISVKQPVDGLILSNTARSGVVGLMKTLSNELAPFGIGVNVVCPGYTRTERLAELATSLSASQGVTEYEIYKRWTDQIPMGRLGDPEELASVVALLCSERAAYVTGTCLQVDGGAVRGIL